MVVEQRLPLNGSTPAGNEHCSLVIQPVSGPPTFISDLFDEGQDLVEWLDLRVDVVGRRPLEVGDPQGSPSDDPDRDSRDLEQPGPLDHLAKALDEVLAIEWTRHQTLASVALSRSTFLRRNSGGTLARSGSRS